MTVSLFECKMCVCMFVRLYVRAFVLVFDFINVCMYFIVIIIIFLIWTLTKEIPILCRVIQTSHSNRKPLPNSTIPLSFEDVKLLREVK